MQVLTIHQIGDFGWFSERKTAKSQYANVISALKSHIRYVESKATAVFNSASQILAKAKAELRKRWDSRVALKFWIAVPKDWNEKKAFEIVLPFISKQLDIPLENISAFYHAHPDNPHIHILAYPRDSKGRKLRLDKKKLSEFHRAWDRLLQELGYEIKRYKNDAELSLPNIPRWLIEKDNELKHLYREFISLRNEIANGLQSSKIKDEILYMADNVSDEEIENAYKSEKAKSILHFWNKKQKTFKEKQREMIELQIKALGLSQEDKVAIVLVGDKKKPLQRILSVEKLLSDKFLAFLRAKNSEGYNVYITLNRLKPSAKKRVKEAFEKKQRNIYLDIDGDKLGIDGLELLQRIIREQELPMPTLLIRTSKYNYQAIWTLEKDRPAQQLEAIMKELARKYGLDHTQDISRVFRLAGFYNRKKEKGNFVYIVQGSTLKPTSFKPFEKLLAELTAVKSRLKRESKNLKQAIQSFRFSKTLDRYREALKETFADFPAVFKEELLNKFDELANQIVSHKKRFKSASEFELAILHRLNKTLLDFGYDTNERQKILLEKFETLLKKVRPEKIKRNPKYPQISVAKIIKPSDPPSAGAERPRAGVSEKVNNTADIVNKLREKAEAKGYTWWLFEIYCKEILIEALQNFAGPINPKRYNLAQLIEAYVKATQLKDVARFIDLLFSEAERLYSTLQDGKLIEWLKLRYALRNKPDDDFSPDNSC